MPGDYRVPNSYVEEAPIANVGINSATAAALFVGAAAAGPADIQQVESWNDFVSLYGAPSGFEAVNDPESLSGGSSVKTFLGYQVYQYFQNGGRPAIVKRATGAGAGTAAVGTIYAAGFTGSPATITNVARAGSTATVTTGSAHGYVSGDVINVSGTTNNSGAFNVSGVKVLSAPTTTTLTYTTPTSGTVASVAVTGTTPRVGKAKVALSVKAKSAASASNFTAGSSTVADKGLVIEATLSGNVTSDVSAAPLFSLTVYKDGTPVENYHNLTLTGADNTVKPGDALRSSTEVDVVSHDDTAVPVSTVYPIGAFSGGVDPDLPTSDELKAAAIDAVSEIPEPIIVVIAGYVNSFLASDRDTFVSTLVSSSDFAGRQDVFIINDNAQQHTDGTSSAAYVALIDNNQALAASTGDTYVASYTPWLVIPDPQSNTGRITVPPGGTVAGVFSRTDANVGVFRAPAGVIANVSNVIDVDVNFTHTQLGNLNTHNINVIRPVPGQGICIMGARTRKPYGIDRYVPARRTLIFIKESLRRSTQFAVFENNDQRLWSNLIVTAESILRPLWEAGGLKGTSAQEAYYVVCDESINTPLVVEAGEVHMNIGVALESPAEFIVIKVAQSQGGPVTIETNA